MSAVRTASSIKTEDRETCPFLNRGGEMSMSYKIALLDDDPKDIDVISNAMKKYTEYDIYGFTSIEELIKSNQQFDVLFLDVEMPQMSGIQLAERIKELKAFLLYL